MAYDIRKIKDTTDLIGYFSENLCWNIDMDYVDDIEDIAYDFTAADIGLKEDAFARISALRQMQPLVDGQKWGIFCVEFDSQRFEVGALRKILSKLIPRRRNSADHAVWDQQDLLFICNWGKDNNRTIGLAHFEDQGKDLPQIRMISCAPAVEDFTQIKIFEDRLSLLRWPKDTSNIEEWRRTWASAFTTGYREVIHTSALLTTRLAAEAQNIRNHILEILEVETENGYVHKLFDKFRETLIHDMTETQFADMYAQTVVYGLFSARCMDVTQDNFSAAEAVNCIPNTNPFLKNLMRECLGANSSRLSFDEMEIGNVVELLRNTHTDAIIQDFNRQTGGGREDPVIHFYEEFLTAYDKAQKVQRGVYYTPQPVVNFIVRAVDDILKTEFGLPEGIASTATKQIKTQRLSERKINGMYRMIDTITNVPAVQVLDPATGTGTFLRQVILQIYENFKQQHRGESKEAIRAAWNEYVPKHLLPRINGFELMMAPYAVAHMKLAMVLKDTGYDFGGEGRLNVCLTNTLEAPGNSEDQISMFDDPLATESVEANKVKKNNGVNVVLGNPPYSGISSNSGEWISEMVEDYKYIQGVHFGERKHWLQDDYVKFIRLNEHNLENQFPAVLAFINNHAFLDNPTFRCMRYHLLQTFDTIYIINLHGNSLIGERCEDGSKDENVFDIQQGVSINLFIRSARTAPAARSASTVKSIDLYGERDQKYRWLMEKSIANIQWQTLAPTAPYYFFVPKDLSSADSYNAGFAVNELMPTNVMGITTARDFIVIDQEYDALLNRIKHFSDLSINDDDIRQEYFPGKSSSKYLPGDTRGWQLSIARRKISTNEHEKHIRTIYYRPFDRRYIYYSHDMVDWDRENVMRHFIRGKNLGICLIRINRDDLCTVLVTDDITDKTVLSSKDNANVFPLYLYEDNCFANEPQMNFDTGILKKIEISLHARLTRNIEKQAQEFTPEQLLYYIYAVLFSPSYRKKYATMLKSEFPRVPYPTDISRFCRLAKLGEQLSDIHLLKTPIASQNEHEFFSIGDDHIEKASYNDGLIYINKTAYFANVDQSIWDFYLAGYQPLQKWCKDRKGQTLTQDDIEHYQQMIAALEETQRIMQEIDKVIEV